MFAGDFISFGAQAGDDALGIDQGFGATEADEGNAGGSGHIVSHKFVGAR